MGKLKEHGCECANEEVVCWENVISCSGPHHSAQVALMLLETLAGPEAVEEMQRHRRGVKMLARHPEAPYRSISA